MRTYNSLVPIPKYFLSYVYPMLCPPWRVPLMFLCGEKYQPYYHKYLFNRNTS